CRPMSASSKPCGSCGHANSGDAMFCSKCGARLADAPPVAAAPAPAARAPEPTPVAMAAPKPRRAAGVAKAMLGGPAQAPVGPPAEPAPEPAPEPSASDDEGHEEAGGAKPAPHRRIAGSARTMLGMPAPDRAAVAQAVAEAKARNAARE